ncbi:MAG: hypothetical protein ACHBNF_10375 [Chromatiales bacterium]
MIKRTLTIATILLAVLIGPAPKQAHAAFTHVQDFYVCSVTFDASSTAMRGSFGFLSVNVFLLRNCTGDGEISTLYFNSTNATETGTDWRPLALMTIFQELRDAQRLQTQVTMGFYGVNSSVESVTFLKQ